MPVPDIVIDTLAKLPGVSYVCVLERDSSTILGASGNVDSGLPAEEIVDAFDSAAGVGGTRGGAVQTVVVAGSRVVQVLALVPLADDSAGVLYLRLVRARANLASALREVESVTGGRSRRSTGQPGVGALPSAAGASARRIAVPSALPGPASGASTPSRGVPAAARTDGSASQSAARPGAATPPPLTPPLATPLPTAPPAPPPSTPAALPSAALVSAPRAAPPIPGPSSAQLERRAEGAVATDPSPAAVNSTPTALAPEPRAPAHEPEESQVRNRSSYLAAEFFAAAHRARPPLPPVPAPPPAPPTGQPRESRGADAGAAQRRGERDPRPGPPTERLSAAPGTAGPRQRVPGPRPAPDDPAGATFPGAAPERAARASSAPSHPSSADERTAGPADDERSPAGADATIADRPVDPHGHAADGTRSDPSDDAAPAPPDALPRRRGDTVIPPPREPENTDQERRWATDLHTLRRLTDGLRRRLR
ncbi:hypothetical protein ACQP04_17120 [Pseudonocardia halophobica]|uniref:hypothetical protein n=1 Tax=Pseudonocardia halophobica TaxID=29401 RepID=UPI003D92C72A